MDQLATLRQSPLWWIVLVSYDRKRRYSEKRWEPIAVFKYEVEAAAYVERHNSHGQAGIYRKISMSNVMELSVMVASTELSLKPDLPDAEALLVGNSVSTSNVNAPDV